MVSGISAIGSSTAMTATRPKPPDPAKLFDQTDNNDDGIVTKDELSAVIDKMNAQGGRGPSADEVFEQMDASGDGQVTEEEHNAFLQKMQEQMQAKMQADQTLASLRLTLLQSTQTETQASTGIASKIDQYTQSLNSTTSQLLVNLDI